MFYNKGKKRIRPELDKYITPLALAVLVMSQPYNYGILKFKTNLTKKEDIYILIIILKNSFGIICYSYNDNKSYYGLGVADESKENFRTLIQPYISNDLLEVK